MTYFSHPGRIQGIPDLEFRFSTTTKGFGRGLPFPGNGEELHNRSFNGLSQSFEDGDSGIFEPSFEPAHVCAVNPGHLRPELPGKVRGEPAIGEDFVPLALGRSCPQPIK